MFTLPVEWKQTSQTSLYPVVRIGGSQAVGEALDDFDHRFNTGLRPSSYNYWPAVGQSARRRHHSLYFVMRGADSPAHEHSIPLQQDGNCRRPVTDGQSPLDVFTGFEDEGYLVPILVSRRADDIDSKFPIDPQGNVLLLNFSHERQCRTL
ncbi:MAG: hypothetical protein WB799_22695 [Candidatus Sulfotelmatobacter sp.]